MNFEDFKNKVRRKLRSFHIGTLGAIVCSVQLLLELYYFALNLFLGSGISDISNIIFLVINCLFDLYLVRYFITAKENNSLAPARTGIVLLVIANYVIPAIRSILTSVFTNSVGITLFSFSLLQAGTLIAMGALSFINAADMLYTSLSFIYLLLSGFVTIGTSVIFLLYPIFAIREQRRGY